MRLETNRDRVLLLMQELAGVVRGAGRVYFTGGASAVLLGWRELTVDVDFMAEPEPPGFFEALPALKERLEINLELASPPDFIPELPGWAERSIFIARHGPLDFYHYDFYSQALAKLERWHTRDRQDVHHMLSDGLVTKDRLRELFTTVEPRLIRYPAIDAPTFAARVHQFTA